MKSERLVLKHLKEIIRPLLDALQFAYQENGSKEDAVIWEFLSFFPTSGYQETRSEMFLAQERSSRSWTSWDKSGTLTSHRKCCLSSAFLLFSLSHIRPSLWGLSSPTMSGPRSGLQRLTLALYRSRVSKRAANISANPTHPGHRLFKLFSSGWRYRDSFSSQAVNTLQFWGFS